MALTYDQKNAVTKKYFEKKITQQAYDSNIFMQRIAKGDRVKIVEGGLKLFHPIRYAELGTAEFIDPDSARVIQHIDTRTALELEWTYLVCDMVMSWAESVQNRGDAAIIKLMADKVAEVQDDIYNKFSKVLFQDQTAKTPTQLDGLFQIIQTTGSATTYAGISSGDAPNWKAGYFDSTTTTLSLFGSGSLAEAIRNCTFIDPPNLIVTTRLIADLYAALLQPSERRVPGNGKSGATDLAFLGIPIIADPHVNTGDLFVLNTDHMWLYVQSGYNFTTKGWEPDPSRYYTDVNMISWVGNLVCDLRRTQGAFTAITQ
ncbi:MAG: phage major capsid protein [bacterium]